MYCLIKNLLFETEMTSIELSFGVFKIEKDINNRKLKIRYSSIQELVNNLNVRVVKEKIPEPLPVGLYLTRNDDIKINGFRIYSTQDLVINQYFIDEELDTQGIKFNKESSSILIQLNQVQINLQEYLNLVNSLDCIYFECIDDNNYKISNISNLMIKDEKVINREIENIYKWGLTPYIIDEDDVILSFVKILENKYQIKVQNHTDVTNLEQQKVEELLLYEVSNLYQKSDKGLGRIQYNEIWGWLTMVQIPVNISYYTNSKQKYKVRSNDYYFQHFLSDLVTFFTFDKKFPNATLWKDVLDVIPITNTGDKKQVEGHTLYSFQTDVMITCYLIKKPPKIPRVLLKIFRSYIINHKNVRLLYDEFEIKQDVKEEFPDGWDSENLGKDNTLKD